MSVSQTMVSKSPQRSSVKSVSRTSSLVVSATPTCPICKGAHSIYRCSDFEAKVPQERLKLVKEKSLCINCLGSKHVIQNCNSSLTCRICKKPHHTLLHFQTPSLPTGQAASSNNAQTLNAMTSRQLNAVLLSTAVVEIADKFGTFHKARALLDSGSEASFISSKCLNRLQLFKYSSSLSISGVGRIKSNATHRAICNIRSFIDPNFALTFEAIAYPNICENLPSLSFDSPNWPHLQHIQLADPQFNTSQQIDLLLGADIFSQVLDSGRIVGNENEPIALNTRFGWVLMGKANTSQSSSLNSFCTQVKLDERLDSTIRQFWECEEISESTSFLSDSDLCAEENFKVTTIRLPTGRFQVNLPFSIAKPSFVNSRLIALRRFFALERRLAKDDSLRSAYHAFMQEYLELGHMRLSTQLPPINTSYYIPHHCVLRPDSLTTKLRVVFDGSAKDQCGLSLNDTLHTGPKLQNDIFAILTRFRTHSIVFTADVKQMYRQIRINPEQCRFQQILWRFSPFDSVQDYELQTVTYGLSAAPFLALRTFVELARQNLNHFPLASKMLLTDVYVDDIVSGSHSLLEARKLQMEFVSLLQSGGFELRKWCSNNPQLLAHLPPDHCQTHPLDFGTSIDVAVKILGLQWNPVSDSFAYSVSPLNRSCTKRTLLSELARIYDPIGFLSPLTFFAKRLIQHLWNLKLDWDDSPPQSIIDTWCKYVAELPQLKSISIARSFSSSYSSTLELHGFCDASELGYAAVVYLRILSSSVSVSLVAAKSKVSPLKVLSIPRLELCAAVLLSRLLRKILDTLSSYNFANVCAWSDSTVALSWISSSPHKWKTFVANRVSQIHSLLPNSVKWLHVKSEDNPADCASRGLLPHELVSHHLWWRGPEWLQSPNLVPFFPAQFPEQLLEQKQVALLATASTLSFLDELLNNISSLPKIQRIIAYCRRFVLIGKYKLPALNKLSLPECQFALDLLVKHVQCTVFAPEIASLKSTSNRLLSKPFRKLAPFIDADGVLRVGGRLEKSSLSFNAKHPILLPCSHRLTYILIENYHSTHLHCGPQTLLSLLRQNYWIISGKRAISHVLSQCFKCFRLNPRSYQPQMGNLPLNRISQLKPFSCVGVDYAGPFKVTMSKSRGSKSLKSYICVFICFATKAIHLELVSDLTSDAFLAALRRFIARRGRCTSIYSDCGTNFVGAARQLNLWLESAVKSEGLSWSFNPPSAPNFGGLWEAGVKSVKTHLYRVVGDQILTFEEFYTVLVQIEALLNSRPLCPISSDPNDLSVLTPGHFLTLEPLSALPDPSLQHLSLSSLSRWQLLQRMHQDFWLRWHREYLHTLQQRNKWHEITRPIKLNEIVIIKSDLAPPLQWRLGRVVQLHPGTDNIIRVVTIKTTQGTVKRPVSKLCPLPELTSV